MKKLLAALTAVALLAPSLSFAAGPTFRVIETTMVRPSKPEIIDLSRAEDGAAGVSWDAVGAGQTEFAVRCRGGARLSVTVNGDVVSYVRCDGRLHAAYRDTDIGEGEASFSVTGDRAVSAYTILKLYKENEDGSRGWLADKEKEAVKVEPKSEE